MIVNASLVAGDYIGFTPKAGMQASFVRLAQRLRPSGLKTELAVKSASRRKLAIVLRASRKGPN